jgi:hypothetical protein
MAAMIEQQPRPPQQPLEPAAPAAETPAPEPDAPAWRPQVVAPPEPAPTGDDLMSQLRRQAMHQPEPAPKVAAQAPVMAPRPVAPPAALHTDAYRASPQAERELLASLSGPTLADPLAAGAQGTSQKQGLFKHLLTQSLLWVVQVDEPDRYSLTQARGLASKAFFQQFKDWGSEARQSTQRHVGSRVERVQEDWRKSGEDAKKASKKTNTRPRG